MIKIAIPWTEFLKEYEVKYHLVDFNKHHFVEYVGEEYNTKEMNEIISFLKGEPINLKTIKENLQKEFVKIHNTINTLPDLKSVKFKHFAAYKILNQAKKILMVYGGKAEQILREDFEKKKKLEISEEHDYDPKDNILSLYPFNMFNKLIEHLFYYEVKNFSKVLGFYMWFCGYKTNLYDPNFGTPKGDASFTYCYWMLPEISKFKNFDGVIEFLKKHGSSEIKDTLLKKILDALNEEELINLAQAEDKDILYYLKQKAHQTNVNNYNDDTLVQNYKYPALRRILKKNKGLSPDLFPDSKPSDDVAENLSAFKYPEKNKEFFSATNIWHNKLDLIENKNISPYVFLKYLVDARINGIEKNRWLTEACLKWLDTKLKENYDFIKLHFSERERMIIIKFIQDVQHQWGKSGMELLFPEVADLLTYYDSKGKFITQSSMYILTTKLSNKYKII